MPDIKNSRSGVTAEPSSAKLDEHSFRLLVQGLGEYGVFVLTPQGRIASWNAGAASMTGYHAAEVVGQHFSILYPRTESEPLRSEQALEQAAERGHVEDEGWRLRKDGSRFWSNEVLTALRNERGDFTGFSVVMRDITERRQQEEQLRQSEEQLRLMVESTTDYAIFMLDENGNIVSWNSGAQAIKGYTAQEAIGTHFSRFYPPEALASNWPEVELRMARVHGRFEDEGWRLRKDGSRFWASVVITALRLPDGHLRGYSKITRDLTERREQEERVKQSEEHFRLIVDSVKDYAIFMIDPEGYVMSWNQGAERIKGYLLHEILGESFARFYTEEDIDSGKPARMLQKARSNGTAHDEGWRLRKDGSRFMADVTITAMVDRTGALRGYVKVTRDMTQAKRIETLEAEGKRLNEFLAMLAHELRNPLAAIRNAVSMLKMGEAGADQFEWCGNIIHRQSGHLARLVDDLLDVSRITSGKITINKEEIDLATIVNRAVESNQHLIQERKHALTVMLPGQPVRLQGDLTRLVQAVSNLINNAAKYTAAGGAIEVTCVMATDEVEIHVKDNGAGMPADLIGKIFEPFQQGERGLDRVDGGLGIGLTLVENIAKLHDGRVEAISEGLDQGSEFILRLPILAPGATAALGSPAQQAAGPQGKKRPLKVLVVDDNRDAAESMAMLIEAIGHSAQTVHDGVAALAAAKEFMPDLVLLDIGLPGMDGYQVAQEFHSSPRLRHVRLAAVTGYGQEQDKKRAKETGFSDFLIKPVSMKQLAQLFESTSDGLGRRSLAAT